MANILQPTDNERATVYAIAWEIVKRQLDTSDTRATPEQIAGLVAKVASRIVVDGGSHEMSFAESESGQKK